MEKEKRKAIIFGAGATYDWGGPKTDELTKLIRKSGFVCIDNETRITEFIFQSLLINGYNENDINFETILSVIEELIIFYSLFDSKKHTPSLQKVFFNSRFEKILNFSIAGGIVKHGFNLEIPKGKPYDWQHSGALNGETPEQFFFQLLLADLLTIINAKISAYAYHTKGHSKILTEANADINTLYINWIKKLDPSNNLIRLYSLNYERVFKVLALKSGINEIFEGFECGETIAAGSHILPNIPRILTDFNCHSYYNLHGSAFWGIEPKDERQLSNAHIFLQGIPQLQINLIEQSYLQVERGKSILISNIIAGYQKVQKGFVSPFKQMQAAFDRDCISADNLYIIGYSFGDEHINISIKTALIYNPNIKIHIVDPAYDERDGKKGYDLLVERFIKIFPDTTPFKKINETCHQYSEGKITVHTVGMKEFLKIQQEEDLSIIA